MGEGGIPSNPDFVVLGLGNPGPGYADTRHNFGFLVLDRLAEDARSRFREGRGPLLVCPFTAGRDRGILAKPLTWMNRSGLAVRLLRDQFPELPLSRLLVVVDDLDLPLGKLRFRRDGGAGGHNGLGSLIDELETGEFPRLRLGIGRPAAGGREDVVDWVLQPFLVEERDLVNEVTDRAVEGVHVFARGGIEQAMNRFNAG
jgi:PTH1 family peptidyl-tRNA hydrolase